MSDFEIIDVDGQPGLVFRTWDDGTRQVRVFGLTPEEDRVVNYYDANAPAPTPLHEQYFDAPAAQDTGATVQVGDPAASPESPSVPVAAQPTPASAIPSAASPDAGALGSSLAQLSALMQEVLDRLTPAAAPEPAAPGPADTTPPATDDTTASSSASSSPAADDTSPSSSAADDTAPAGARPFDAGAADGANVAQGDAGA